MAAPNLAWGGFSNGRIPASNLVDIGSGKLLQADAASNFKRFAAAFRARWGEPLYLASYQDAYRDLARQQYMYDHPYEFNSKGQVATPGTSVHGWARSVDVSGYGAGGSERHLWMQQNAGTYGYSWAYGKQLGESWHWDYVGPITTTAGGGAEPFPESEDEMKLIKFRLGSSDFFLGARGLYRSPDAGQTAFSSDANNGLLQKDFGALNSTSCDLLLRPFGFSYADAMALGPGAFIPPAVNGGFTTADRAKINEIDAKVADLPTNGEMGQALTSTVALVNEHADENKDAIIAAIPGGSGGSASTYSLNLNIDQVPGTATGTATPQ